MVIITSQQVIIEQISILKIRYLFFNNYWDIQPIIVVDKPIPFYTFL